MCVGRQQSLDPREAEFFIIGLVSVVEVKTFCCSWCSGLVVRWWSSVSINPTVERASRHLTVRPSALISVDLKHCVISVVNLCVHI